MVCAVFMAAGWSSGYIVFTFFSNLEYITTNNTKIKKRQEKNREEREKPVAILVIPPNRMPIISRLTMESAVWNVVRNKKLR